MNEKLVFNFKCKQFIYFLSVYKPNQIVNVRKCFAA